MRRTRLPGWRRDVHPGFYYHQGIRASIAFSVVIILFGVIFFRDLVAHLSFPSEELYALREYIKNNRLVWFTYLIYSAIAAGIAYVLSSHLGLLNSGDSCEEIEFPQHRQPSFPSDIDIATLLPQHSQDSSDVSRDYDLTSIEPLAFEKLVSNLLQIQQRRVVEIGGSGPDGGIDLIVDRFKSSPIAVQCKKYYRQKINVSQMRSFIGAMRDGGFDSGIFVTLKGFTTEAQATAQRHRIELWDSTYIHTLIENNRELLNDETLLILNARNPTCPKCNATMITRRAKKGRFAGLLFWACPRRQCQSTYPYGNERRTGHYS